MPPAVDIMRKMGHPDNNPRVVAFAVETWKAVADAPEWPLGERGALMIWLVGGERGNMTKLGLIRHPLCDD